VIENKYVDIVEKYFSDERLFPQPIEQWSCNFKNWKLGQRAFENLGRIITNPNNAIPKTSSDGKDTIILRDFLKKEWSSFDNDKKLELANWIVRDWGGVRRNNEETIKSHILLTNELDTRITNVPLIGIASSSKIFTLKDPQKYAIYDARVAAALNAILKNSGQKEIVYFPNIPSQNTVIKKFTDDFNKQNHQYITESTAYSEYLNLLNKLKERFQGYEIYHFEMVLFVKAIELCTPKNN